MRGKIVTLLAVAAALLLIDFTARAETRSFRYELETKSGELKYSGELTNPEAAKGPRYDVETDEKGRTRRVATFHNGLKASETVYLFSEGEKLPHAYEYFEAGELTGKVEIERNQRGARIRYNWKTIQGTLTSYTKFLYGSDENEEIRYSVDGKETVHFIRNYSPLALQIRYRRNSGGSQTVSTVYEVEESTGHNISARELHDGKLVNTQKYAYDAEGRLSRRDAYGPTDEWFTGAEYEAELPVKMTYKDGRQFRVAYDEKRNRKETKVYYGEKYICSIVYDRYADGAIKRSLAKGPDGDLWAEYPNASVLNIYRDGQQVGQTNAVIYKKGNWW